jgi:hypothetical protein
VSHTHPTEHVATEPAQARQRPFGVLVVALIQVGTVALVLIGALSAWVLPWEGVFTTYLVDNSWARLVILLVGAAALVAVVGMWRLRYWGWALMVALVGVSLVLDLTTWWRAPAEAGLALYGRLTLDVVSAFYLNTRAVQDAFRREPVEPPEPIAGTRSAGRIEP